MKKLFLVLSLCLGFSVGFALDGILQIQSVVEHPQTGQHTTINLGTHTFDVFRDRRELVREVYGICQNPPAKVKTFIANRINAGDWTIIVKFKFKDTNPINRNGEKIVQMMSCEYDNGKFRRISYSSIYYDDTYTKIRPLNEIIDSAIVRSDFSRRFALFIDAARAEAKAKDINVSVPNKTITISFGAKVINDVGAESVSIYPSLDYKFNVYDDRRELWKATFNACTQLRGNILREIDKGNKNPSVSVWYEHPNGGLVELKSLKCEFNGDGRYINYGGNNYGEYQRGEINAQSISQADIEQWADWKTIVTNNNDSWANDRFIHDFMTLIDVANAGAKQGKKQAAKKANK